MPHLLPLLLSALLLLPGQAAPGDGAAWQPPAVWPTGAPATVVRAFDPPPQPWRSGHRGADLSASPGGAIGSPLAGVVVFAAVVVDRPVVVVQSGRLRISLEPVEATVPVGTRVAPGDQVGVLADGPGHCRPRHCLHWGVRHDGTYVDPLLLVVRHRAVLLP